MTLTFEINTNSQLWETAKIVAENQHRDQTQITTCQYKDFKIKATFYAKISTQTEINEATYRFSVFTNQAVVAKIVERQKVLKKKKNGNSRNKGR